MKRIHIIQDGIIVNTILAELHEAEEAFPEAICLDAEVGGNIGDGYDANTGNILVLQVPKSAEDLRLEILSKLKEIDLKTPRAVREAIITGDSSRIQQLESEAEFLRSQLI